MGSKAARRYANAFLITALEKDSLEKAKDDILLIKNTLDQSSELRLFLRSPIIKKEQKRSALEAVFEKKISPLSVNLLRILSEKSREPLLGDITRHFLELYNKHHGIIEVQITSSTKLDDKQLTALVNKLESVTGKKVEASISVDEDLIGGLTVRIDDTVVDGSVKYKLNELKERFTSAAVD
jgi:F-type H+-transporting ATPase subunit delta